MREKQPQNFNKKRKNEEEEMSNKMEDESGFGWARSTAVTGSPNSDS